MNAAEEPASANQHVFSHGMRDTRAALDAWRGGNWAGAAGLDWR